MEEYVEARVRLIGAGVQLTLLGLVALKFGSVGMVLVVFGTVVTFAGLV